MERSLSANKALPIPSATSTRYKDRMRNANLEFLYNITDDEFTREVLLKYAHNYCNYTSSKNFVPRSIGNSKLKQIEVLIESTSKVSPALENSIAFHNSDISRKYHINNLTLSDQVVLETLPLIENTEHLAAPETEHQETENSFIFIDELKEESILVSSNCVNSTIIGYIINRSK